MNFDSDKIICCPYNRTHKFSAYKLHDHLMRCKEGLKSKEKLYFCSGNAFICFVGENERYEHLKKCKLCNGIDKICNKDYDSKRNVEVDVNNDSYTVIENSNFMGYVPKLHSQEYYYKRINDPEIIDEYVNDYKQRRLEQRYINKVDEKEKVIHSENKIIRKKFDEDKDVRMNGTMNGTMNGNINFTMNLSRNDSIKYVNDTWFDQTKVLNKSELENSIIGNNDDTIIY